MCGRGARRKKSAQLSATSPPPPAGDAEPRPQAGGGREAWSSHGSGLGTSKPAEEPGARAQGLFARGLFAPPAAQMGAVPPPEPPPSGAASRRSRGGRAHSEPSTRGRHLRALPGAGVGVDIAWDASLRAAALGRSPGSTGLLPLRRADLWRTQRVRRPGRIVLFVVDASGSMGPTLTGVARRVALGLLEDAYLRRDRVALIAFRERGAKQVLPPTDRPERVHDAMGALQFGGTTPLSAALRLSRATLARAAAAGARPVLVLISDGRGNVGSTPGRPVRADVEVAARELCATRGLATLLLDATEEGADERPARRIAHLLGATRVSLWRLRHAGADPAHRLLGLLDAMHPAENQSGPRARRSASGERGKR